MSSKEKRQDALLCVNDVGLIYADKAEKVRVLQHINFSLQAGQHLTVVGPSGCGKSSLLRIIAGLQAPTEGTVYFQGQKMAAPHPDLAIVFQDYGLFPWKSVEENILLPARLHDIHLKKEEVTALLERLGLEKVRRHYPGELSGGQKQRTALGRVMVMRPKLLLMDEPFSALDPAMRSQCRQLFQEFVQKVRQRRSSSRTAVKKTLR